MKDPTATFFPDASFTLLVQQESPAALHLPCPTPMGIPPSSDGRLLPLTHLSDSIPLSLAGEDHPTVLLPHTAAEGLQSMTLSSAAPASSVQRWHRLREEDPRSANPNSSYSQLHQLHGLRQLSGPSWASISSFVK